jgi:hypothetical protein
MVHNSKLNFSHTPQYAKATNTVTAGCREAGEWLQLLIHDH